MIKEIDSLIPYLLWKISTNSVRQKEQQLLCFHNINYDLKDEKWNIDDFLEIKDKTKTELYLFYITFLIQNDLVSVVKIRILDDNNPYKTEANGSDDFLNLYLDIDIDQDFLEKNSNIFPDFHGSDQSTKEKDYNKFIGGFYSMKETLQINNLEVGKLKENFHIYFFYKPNLEKISLYIQEYLLEWGNEKLTPTENYIRPSMQIQYFRNYIIDHINNYGNEFIYHTGTNSKLDEITLILYYNITGYIELLKFDEGVDRINGFQHKNINFKIRILPKFFDDFTKKEGISFDENSGTVILDGKSIGVIKLATQEFLFFKYLCDNKGNGKTHTEIKEYIKGQDKIESTNSKFCSDIKSRLDKPIRDLIEAPKGKYIIR